MINLNDNFPHQGTQRYYYFDKIRMNFTDGIMSAMKNYDMQQLIIFFATTVYNKYPNQRMLIMKISNAILEEGDEYTECTITDGNEEVLESDETFLPHKLPEGELTLWIMNDRLLDPSLDPVMLLPSEY